jgi:cell division protein FtsI/penicillin-binding protein 2
MEGEDLVARRAAVEALGPFNGSVVVVDPSNGRLLTVVNQKQAFQKSYLPCSTVKLVAAVGSLLEGNIDRYTTQRLSRYTYMNLTEAMARSNNPYFANLGGQLGFAKVHSYASMLGLGEPATIGVPEEKAGWLTEATPKTGIGMMTTFGDGVHQTPVQLAAMLTAFANGGTLYFLQHPKTNEEAHHLLPVIKRQLNISHILDDLKAGMRGAVEFGSARRAGYAASEENIFGKTGTCTHSDGQTHLGWFGSFAEDGDRKLVVVVLLTGGRPISGPVASGIAGNFYRRYSQLRGMRADATLPLPELACCGN